MFHTKVNGSWVGVTNTLIPTEGEALINTTKCWALQVKLPPNHLHPSHTLIRALLSLLIHGPISWRASLCCFPPLSLNTLLDSCQGFHPYSILTLVDLLNMKQIVLQSAAFSLSFQRPLPALCNYCYFQSCQSKHLNLIQKGINQKKAFALQSIYVCLCSAGKYRRQKFAGISNIGSFFPII